MRWRTNWTLTISTNTGDVRDAVKSIKAASASLQQLADGLQAGHGLAGSLMKDETMKENFQGMITNISSMTEQIGAFAHRLNESSLWQCCFTNPPPPTRRGAERPNGR